MKWLKKGFIYGPTGDSHWADNSALQPTPILLSERIIRVYVGFRDEFGVGRVGFVDVDVDNPSVVRYVSEDPALDIGVAGAFDDNGVVPCAVVRRGNEIFLYYAGYQLVDKVKFLAFGGLAISRDGGDTFTRYSRVPVMERTSDELYFRVIHSIRLEEGRWRAWYGGGSQFIDHDGRVLPVYDIRYTESDDGIRFNRDGQVCIGMAIEDEHRVGRPYVIRDGDLYRMFYAVGTKSRGFRLGYAESTDGFRWDRKDAEVGIDVSDNGWDSEMISYPSVVQRGSRVYMFYNGNDYGKAGFGYAELGSW